jgi:hypothetical protein
MAKATQQSTNTGVPPQTPGGAAKPARPGDAILARIVAEYRPYDTLGAFGEGFTAYQHQAVAFRRNPYEDQTGLQAGVNAQAWDRGANAAMMYRRATDHLDAVPDAPEGPENALERLLRTGRC